MGLDQLGDCCRAAKETVTLLERPREHDSVAELTREWVKEYVEKKLAPLLGSRLTDLEARISKLEQRVEEIDPSTPPPNADV